MINGPDGTILTTQGWMYPESGVIAKPRRVSQALVDRWNLENQYRMLIEREDKEEEALLSITPVQEEPLVEETVQEEPLVEETVQEEPLVEETVQDDGKSFEVMELIHDADNMTKKMLVSQAEELSIELEMGMTKVQMLEALSKHL